MERGEATAREVLGSVELEGEVDPRWRRYFDRLMKMREELLERRGDWGDFDVAEANFNVNPADRASDEYDMGQAFSLLSSDQNSLFEIEEALMKIREGTYGVCEVTGEVIPEERLEAVPWTRYAREVEERLERVEIARRPKHAL